jgi:hypothetical protein
VLLTLPSALNLVLLTLTSPDSPTTSFLSYYRDSHCGFFALRRSSYLFSWLLGHHFRFPHPVLTPGLRFLLTSCGSFPPPTREPSVGSYSQPTPASNHSPATSSGRLSRFRRTTPWEGTAIRGTLPPKTSMFLPDDPALSSVQFLSSGTSRNRSSTKSLTASLQISFMLFPVCSERNLSFKCSGSGRRSGYAYLTPSQTLFSLHGSTCSSDIDFSGGLLLEVLLVSWLQPFKKNVGKRKTSTRRIGWLPPSNSRSVNSLEVPAV